MGTGRWGRELGEWRMGGTEEEKSREGERESRTSCAHEKKKRRFGFYSHAKLVSFKNFIVTYIPEVKKS